jgi:hypothetical protein
MTLAHNSLGSELAYNNVLVTDVNSQPPALASLINLEHSRVFLLENLKPESLFFNLVSLAGNDSPSFIYSSFNYVL